ncbi:MAG: PASTA domain-containing protein [Clostridia bacterium]|nr:PASTA domain-containing protein [Clostridia bacterium]
MKGVGNVIVMSPKTGDILAMATYPDYNLNNRLSIPSHIDEKTWNKMSGTEQSSVLNNLYRNRAISDPYEPGSVFKIITASIALEENLASANKAWVYNCKGGYTVSGSTMYCSLHTVHGKQSLEQALSNSCNSAFIQIGQKIGASTAYRYYNAFGFFNKTGIATSGEANNSIFWDLENVGPLEIATMSFGQRFKITPLQMITAASVVANDGILMQPRIVKETKNTDTGAITTTQPVQVRQVISKETAQTMMNMLETVVTDGSGKYAQAKGYSIAGKTGTSEPDYAKDEGYTASFLAISPTENPEVVILVTLYAPKGPKGHFGSSVAAPVAAQILKEVLPYMQIASDGSDDASNKTTSLPNVTNKTIGEAKKILNKAGFTCSTTAKDDEIVKEQYPTKGTSLIKNSIIKLYTETENTRVSTAVPNLTGKNLSQVKNLLKEKNLNLSVSGSGIVVSQDPIGGTSVEEGTVVKVTLAQ